MHVSSHDPVLLLRVKMSMVLLGGRKKRERGGERERKKRGKKNSWGPKPLDISHVPDHFTD